ncbi:MAG TPA: hypothetical protein DEB39_09710 [Planctomycetaceae bacterium]|nr:hypothetical protein [Planctomycetaceae bacterium]
MRPPGRTDIIGNTPLDRRRTVSPPKTAWDENPASSFGRDVWPDRAFGSGMGRKRGNQGLSQTPDRHRIPLHRGTAVDGRPM